MYFFQLDHKIFFKSIFCHFVYFFVYFLQFQFRLTRLKFMDVFKGIQHESAIEQTEG